MRQRKRWLQETWNMIRMHIAIIMNITTVTAVMITAVNITAPDTIDQRSVRDAYGYFA